MPWTERQRAMLREMGLRVWQAEASVAVPAAVPDPGLGPAVATPADRPAAQVEAESPARPPRAPTRAAPASEPVTPPAAAPQPIDAGLVAGLDWPALREAVAACRACRLCEQRKQTVFGVGHPNAHWMVVGEAPGAQEDEQGEPFIGAAGQLLDAMLRSLGLSRASEGDAAARVFIANTLKCRPPGNRNPQPDEMQRCEPFLVRQIQLVRPRIILAMGRFAVQALLRTSEPIGRLRGRVHRYQGVPLVVTYHPAYLLRNLPDKARAWEDLCLAADVLAALPEPDSADAADAAVHSGTPQR
ncbi:MAG: uracil-DNA glycosylase [Betaproteobacteria bacterium]|nr:uracil-DNA glycosylase [Betaproteobacteria bacterium]